MAKREKLPYGGFDFNFSYLEKNEPWENLRTIWEFLHDAEPIPPDLAYWLGEAIFHSQKDPEELMRRLGLKKGRGRPSSSGDGWLIWGKRVCELEDQGQKAETAIDMVLTENDDKISRSQLQKWRDIYRKAWTDSQSAYSNENHH